MSELPEDIIAAADRIMDEAGSKIDGITIDEAMSGEKRIRGIYRDAIGEALLTERERCAAIAKNWKGHPADFPFAGKQIADLIRNPPSHACPPSGRE